MQSRRRLILRHFLGCILVAGICVWMLMFCYRNHNATGYDDVGASASSQLQVLRSQIELMRVRNGYAPDLSNGWSELIDAGLLSDGPVGILAGPPWHSTVATDLDQVHDAGDAAWYYDELGRLYPVCSATFAGRYQPNLRGMHAIIVPDAPIRYPRDLLRPFSATRPAVLVLGWAGATAVAAFGLSLLTRKSPALLHAGDLVAACSLCLVPAALFSVLWMTTPKIKFSGDPGGTLDSRSLGDRATGLVPYLFIVIVCTATLIGTRPLTSSQRRQAARRLVRKRHRCSHCGYDTRKNPLRCSECGRPLPPHRRLNGALARAGQNTLVSPR